MSQAVIDWVFTHAPQDASVGEMLVALCLATDAADDGACVRYSIADLARRTRLCERQVVRVLKRLTARGVLAITEPATHHTPNAYGFPALARGDIRSIRGDISDSSGVTFAPSGVTFAPSGVTFEAIRGDISDSEVAITPDPVIRKKYVTSRTPSTTPYETDDPPDGGADAPEVLTPWAIFAAVCEAAEQDIGGYTKRDKGRYLAVAKRLLAEGITVSEAGALVGWLRSQGWRTEPVTLFTVERELGVWRAAGRPAVAQARASPGASSGRTADGRLKVM